MKLEEIHEELNRAATEMEGNHDTYAAVLKLANALELVLRYLEEQESAHQR
jgi:hypothetical protein